ncbi:MAG: hypothetical protein ACOY4H_15915 [Thermodesulfobacteriota bacterium]
MKAQKPEITVQTKKRTSTDSATRIESNAEISRAALMALSAPSALIGVWSLACLVGALVASGGPVALAQSWFSAISGM